MTPPGEDSWHCMAQGESEKGPAIGSTTSPAPGEWNVLVTARQRCQRRLRRALFPLVRLRPSGFRDVLVGRVDDAAALLAGIVDVLARRPEIAAALGRVLPVDRVFAVDAGRLDEQLRAEATAFVDRLRGRSFHVRLRRRGHKGSIDSQAVERSVGDALCRALEERGARPVVTFDAPDFVLAIEILGDEVGMALIERDRVGGYPFVRLD